MATIIDLKALERRARPGLSWSEPGAEILLFTGVRYERWADAEMVTPQPGRAGGKPGGSGRSRRKRA